MSCRLYVALHIAAGVALMLAGWAAGSRAEIAAHWHGWQRPMIAAGLVLLLAAAFHRRKWISSVSATLCVSVLSLLLVVTALESAFRSSGFDFSHSEASQRNLPPFYRRPTVPVGTGFFRREGPDEWSGPVIRECMEQFHVSSEAYCDEPAITVRYDSHGFRNERWPAFWEIAVAGDSFVELGNLPFNELFTTLLGSLTQRPVLNLGASHTGPLTQLCYLENYGVSRRTRHVVVVFYEGNDLEDVAAEHKVQERFESTGQRPLLRFEKQTSMIRALGEQFSKPRFGTVAPRVNAHFTGRQGKIPITLLSRLVTNVVAGADKERAFDYFLERYGAFGTARGVQTWLAFMPCKTRALEGQFEWLQPEEALSLGLIHRGLPSAVAEKCSRHGIRFIDLTPALVKEGERAGELLYNSVFDSHLNARGSKVVARVLAESLCRNDPD